MADLHFEFNRGSYGYRYDWEGERVIIKAVGAAKVAVNECMELAVEHARANHPDYPPPSDPYGRYANRTFQMTEHIKVLEPAEVSWDGRFPWVHGEWGIEDGPAYQDPDEWREEHKYRRPAEGELAGTLLERAIFLEFGTVRMAPRPFLYPAWDETKVQMPRLYAEAFAGMRGGNVSGGLADFIQYVRRGLG